MRLVEDEEARKAVVDLEVGKNPRGVVSDPRGDHRAAAGRQPGEHRFRADFGGRPQLDVGGHDQFAGNAGQPFGMHGVEGGGFGIEGLAAGQRAEEGVAGKLGMQFPAHAETAGVEHQVRVRTFDRMAGLRLAQARQVVPCRLRLGGAVLEHQVRDQHRAHQRNRRAGVELVVQALAERVLDDFGDRETRVHGGIGAVFGGVARHFCGLVDSSTCPAGARPS